MTFRIRRLTHEQFRIMVDEAHERAKKKEEEKVEEEPSKHGINVAGGD